MQWKLNPWAQDWKQFEATGACMVAGSWEMSMLEKHSKYLLTEETLLISLIYYYFEWVLAEIFHVNGQQKILHQQASLGSESASKSRKQPELPSLYLLVSLSMQAVWTVTFWPISTNKGLEQKLTQSAAWQKNLKSQTTQSLDQTFTPRPEGSF